MHTLFTGKMKTLTACRVSKSFIYVCLSDEGFGTNSIKFHVEITLDTLILASKKFHTFESIR